ncbi:MAG: DNA double-strand break repair nuclease NurA [Leptolyngbyaceae cyanobacterium bins.59]|nr:DNA double-strand break repair nuclease NurA [Leptolyngbyaceae cyanobacterium bins.59]
MLDLTKVAQQMQGISQHLTQEATASRQRLERAATLMGQATAMQRELMDRRQAWIDRMAFIAAEPAEPLDTRLFLETAPSQHTVVATDGSQIAPSHHEIAYFYLINVGRVVLHYGQNLHPLLDSLPEVFYRPEDLYISRQWGIRTEEWMGYCRTASETVALVELVQEVQSSFTPHPLLAPPLLAMVDGSLIHWFLETLPAEARDRILSPMLVAWESLRSQRVPLVGYVSASRSGEAINFLRLLTCPYAEPDCQTHCSAQSDRTPCQVLDPLKDTVLWGSLLEPGQRSPLWRSSARILELYGPHTIYFCYVHLGIEVARLEFPAWVAEDSNLLQTALSLTLAQVQKGYGYPVALAEAHNQAVVRGSDRARFFALLEQQMIRSGLKNVGTSYKEARKRGSIA